MRAVSAVRLGLPSSLATVVELTKPRVMLLVLVTTAGGAFLSGDAASADLLLLLLGTGFACAGASAVNMAVEGGPDGRMARTRSRPVPTGRIRPGEAFLLGLLLGASGIGCLLFRPTAAAIAAASFLGYTAIYTPLKRVTPLSILAGAVPGALPPLIGYMGAGGRLDLSALWMFGILYFWQIPHFLSIDWLYREQYEAAGFRTFAVVDKTGAASGMASLLGALILLPVSLVGFELGVTGMAASVCIGLLGLLYAVAAANMAFKRTERAARLLLRASILYLPLVFILLATGVLQ